MAKGTVVANEHVGVLNSVVLEFEFERVLRREIFSSDGDKGLVGVESGLVSAVEHLLEEWLGVYDGDLGVMGGVLELGPVENDGVCF